jgi:hypothetical protein
MVVLVAGERQPEPFDGVGDEDRRAVVVDRLESLEDVRQVVAAEIGHEARELLVRAGLDEPRHRPLVAEIVEQAFSPGRAPLKGERRVELVRRAVDPGAQFFAARLLEGDLLQRAVFQRHHVPAEGGKNRLEAGIKALADDGIEALAVVVDDPPGVAQALLPAFKERLENVAFVHLGVADERDHAAFRPLLRPAVRLDVVLHERGEERLRDA